MRLSRIPFHDSHLPRQRSPQRLQNRQLLPDFARKTCGQILDVINRIQQDRVLETLNVKGGDFADERQRLATVIQVPIQLEGRHGTLHGRGLLRREIALGVLGQLMHIDDMRQGAQFVDRLQCTASFDAVFPGHQEKNGGADEHDRTDAGFQSLNEVGVVVELKLPDVYHHQGRQCDNRQAQHRCSATQQ